MTHPSSLPLEGFAVLNDTPVACQIREPTRRETGGSRRLTDEVLPPSRPQAYFQFPRRRQPPPTHCGAPRRNGRDLIIAQPQGVVSKGGGPKPPPLSLQGDRILKERGKFEIPLSLSGVLWLLSFDMKRKQLAPAGATPACPRAKGSLNRRFEWFSLVTFF